MLCTGVFRQIATVRQMYVFQCETQNFLTESIWETKTSAKTVPTEMFLIFRFLSRAYSEKIFLM